MSHIWDLPPTSGSIIWARQVERQLNTYMKRVEDVLGMLETCQIPLFCQFYLTIFKLLRAHFLIFTYP